MHLLFLAVSSSPFPIHFLVLSWLISYLHKVRKEWHMKAALNKRRHKAIRFIYSYYDGHNNIYADTRKTSNNISSTCGKKGDHSSNNGDNPST